MIRDWRNMLEPVGVDEAAGRMGWGKLAVWMLIRQRRVKWAIRGVRVVVDLKEVYAWKTKNLKTATELENKIGADQKHPMTKRNGVRKSY